MIILHKSPLGIFSRSLIGSNSAANLWLGRRAAALGKTGNVLLSLDVGVSPSKDQGMSNTKVSILKFS